MYFLTHLVELNFSYLQNIDVQLIWMIIQKNLFIYVRVLVHLIPAPVESTFEHFFIADHQWENLLCDLSSIISWN